MTIKFVEIATKKKNDVIKTYEGDLNFNKSINNISLTMSTKMTFEFKKGSNSNMKKKKRK